jgi:hypothetical protein
MKEVCEWQRKKEGGFEIGCCPGKILFEENERSGYKLLASEKIQCPHCGKTAVPVYPGYLGSSYISYS